MNNVSNKPETTLKQEKSGSLLSPIIDFDRYPLKDLESAEFNQFVRKCRAEYIRQGYVALHELISPNICAELTQEANSLLMLGRRIDYERTAYCVSKENLASANEVCIEADDPRNLLLPRGIWLLSGQLFNSESRIRAFYNFEPLLKLYESIAEYPIYPLSEQNAQVNIVAQGNGDSNNWHFDPDLDMTATLMLQTSESGGHFELVRDLQDPHGKNRDSFRAILTDQSEEGVVKVPQGPGTLLIFNSRTSLHRVTQVKGSKIRFLVVFSYSNHPNVCLDEAITASSYR